MNESGRAVASAGPNRARRFAPGAHFAVVAMLGARVFETLAAAADGVNRSGYLEQVPRGYPGSTFAVRWFTSGAPIILALGAGLAVAIRSIVRTVRRRRDAARPRLRGRARPLAVLKLVAALAIGIASALAIRPFLALAAWFLKWPLLLLTAVFVVVYVRALRSPDSDRLRRKLRHGAAIAFPVLVFVGVKTFYHYVRPDCVRIRADRRLDPILSECDGSIAEWAEKVAAPVPACQGDDIRYEPRLVFPSSDGDAWYLGFGYLEHPCPGPIVKIDARTRAPKHVIWMFSPWKGFCDPSSHRCLIPSFQGHSLLIVDDANDRLEEDLKLVDFMPSFMAADPRTGTAYIPAKDAGEWVESSADVALKPIGPILRNWRSGGPIPGVPCEDCNLLIEWRAQRSEFSFRAWQSPRVRGGAAFAALEPNHRYLLYGDAVPRTALIAVPLDGSAPVEVPLPWRTFLRTFGIGLSAAFDTVRNEVFVSFSLGDQIDVFDSTTFVHKRTIPLELGVREIAFDERRRLLYVTGYVSGDVIVYDVDAEVVRERIYVGPKIRHLYFDPDGDRLVVASKAGFFAIRLANLATAQGPAASSPSG